MSRNRWLILVVVVALGACAAGAFAAAWWFKQPRQVLANYHRWFHRNDRQTYNNTRWMGVAIQKCPLDTWVFQELLFEVRPDVMVETGTYKGGSSFYYASLMDLMRHGRVITVDIEDYPGKTAHDRVKFLLGSSTAPETLKLVRAAIAPGEKVMVTLDSDHHAGHVAQELSLYCELVTPGSYLIVEDTHFNGRPILPKFGPGPYEAVEEFLRVHPEFERDLRREKFGMTFNPGGWLRRTR